MTARPTPDVADFRMLLSYHYFRMLDLEAELRKHFGDGPLPEVFADSGAFSALTQGAPVDVDEYGKWVVRNKYLFRVYSNLDVVGDDQRSADGTWQNQRHLEDEYGLRPLPVFHAGEPWSALERLLEHGYRYIALGGLVGRSAPSIMPWLVRCFRMAGDDAVFHGFGLTTKEPTTQLPWYSVDSSSWGSGYRYGFLRMFDPSTGWHRQIPMTHAEVYRPEHARLIRALGFDPKDFADSYAADRTDVAYISACSWRALERWLRKRHGPVLVPPGGIVPEGVPVLDEDDRRIYLAQGSLPNLALGAGIRAYAADTAPDNLARTAGSRVYLADTTGTTLSMGAGARSYLASSHLPELRDGAGITQGDPE